MLPSFFRIGVGPPANYGCAPGETKAVTGGAWSFSLRDNSVPNNAKPIVMKTETIHVSQSSPSVELVSDKREDGFRRLFFRVEGLSVDSALDASGAMLDASDWEACYGVDVQARVDLINGRHRLVCFVKYMLE